MAKTVAKKNKSKDDAAIPASFAKKNAGKVSTAPDNPSKFSPTDESVSADEMLAPVDGLNKLLIDSLRDLYWAENHLVKALPKMAKAASSEALKGAIVTHLEETKTHVRRLEEIFGQLNVEPRAQKCDAMEGLTKEGEGVVEMTEANTPSRNLGIIMASSKVEHYEISAYSGLIQLAAKLELPGIADLLSQTLNEEVEADDKLVAIGDNEILVSSKDNE